LQWPTACLQALPHLEQRRPVVLARR